MVNELVYDVTKLDGSSTERVHCARLMLYRAADEITTVRESLLELAERTEANNELVKRFHDNRDSYTSNGLVCRRNATGRGILLKNFMKMS